MLTLACAWCAGAQENQADWQQRVKSLVAAGSLNAALEETQGRLAVAPGDLEARGWRARIEAWAHRWPEAEADYRAVLSGAPNDADVLLGLATLLRWEGRNEEALSLLSRAEAQTQGRSDVEIERGRVLRALGRKDEARRAFLQARQNEALPTVAAQDEALSGLRSLEDPPRHELRMGNETDFFNYTDNANTQTVSLLSRWDMRWTTSVEGDSYQRFGEDAGKAIIGLTRRFASSDSLTVGGGAGHDSGVIPKSEAFFEYVRGFHFGESGPIRGLETGYRQHWYWYQGARVLTLTGNLLFYLPRGVTWQIAGTGARNVIGSTKPDWQPAALTRLDFPFPGRARNRLSANLLYSVGSEDFAIADQIGRLSARTYGCGARLHLSERQDVAGFVAYQNRSQGRTLTALGFNYGIHF